jgi:hypothetical protein
MTKELYENRKRELERKIWWLGITVPLLPYYKHELAKAIKELIALD